MTRLLPMILVVALGFLSNVDAAACPPKARPYTGADADCDCGSTPQKCTVNQYCDSTGTGTCSTDPFCPDDKTTQVPVTKCTCKTQSCNQNQYCDSTGTGTCSADPFCPDDKTTKITVTKCKCKDKTCNQNEYCDSSAATGTCIPACPDKTTKITAECGCG
ncbi:hypothetical protein AAVH_16517 [Aphelenchoides avenae]|nr:hypothetical protein AAVH_16517 [Aphelenchus avenae]